MAANYVTYTKLLYRKKNAFDSLHRFQKNLSAKVSKKFGVASVFVSAQPRIAVHVMFSTLRQKPLPSEDEVLEFIWDATHEYIMKGV